MASTDPGYSVQLAVTGQDLDDACAVRAAAYGHHDPQMGARLGQADALDRAAGTAVFLCRARVGGGCLGTTRIQVSGFGPLALESSLQLPAWLCGRPRAQISRLAVAPGAGVVVKLLLMKACYQYCLATQVRWMVIGARSAALIRNYRSLGFRDVFAPGAWIPLASGGGLPHQILTLDVAGAKDAWQATKNRLLGFMTDVGQAEQPVLAAIDDVVRPATVQFAA